MLYICVLPTAITLPQAATDMPTLSSAYVVSSSTNFKNVLSASQRLAKPNAHRDASCDDALSYRHRALAPKRKPSGAKRSQADINSSNNKTTTTTTPTPWTTTIRTTPPAAMATSAVVCPDHGFRRLAARRSGRTATCQRRAEQLAGVSSGWGEELLQIDNAHQPFGSSSADVAIDVDVDRLDTGQPFA